MNNFPLLPQLQTPKRLKIIRNGHVKTTLTRQRTNIVNRQRLQLLRFLVIHSQEERSVSSLSPFVIEKVLDGMIGTQKSI